MASVRLTMLNSMAGRDFAAALAQHRAWGLSELDLKDSILGKALLDLTDDEAAEAAGMIRATGMRVCCMSTQLFHRDVELGEREFTADADAGVTRAIELARVLRPRFVRLLAARSGRRDQFVNSTTYLRGRHPWVFDLYRAAVDRIAGAGFLATIENETHGSIFARPEEVLGFFEIIGRPIDAVCYTWDVQNMWQVGSFPTMHAYRMLRPLMRYLHVKGGRADVPGGPLAWASSLRDASWPVLEIVRAAVADGASPVICLNPTHGQAPPGFDYGKTYEDDLQFLREHMAEIE